MWLQLSRLDDWAPSFSMQRISAGVKFKLITASGLNPALVRVSTIFPLYKIYLMSVDGLRDFFHTLKLDQIEANSLVSSIPEGSHVIFPF